MICTQLYIHMWTETEYQLTQEELFTNILAFVLINQQLANSEIESENESLNR